MRITKRAAMICAALVLPAFVVGCGSAGSSQGTATATDAKTAAATVQAASAAPTLTGSVGPALAKPANLAGKTVYYIPISLKVAYFTNEFAGFKEAMSKVGATAKACDGQFTPDGVAQCVDQAIGARAAAVVTSAIPYEMASTAFGQLAKAGIPVLLANAEPSSGSPAGISYLSGDWFQFKESELAADAVIADSNGKANVLYLEITDSPSLINMGDAAVSELKAKCPGCRVTVVGVPAAQTSQIPSIVSGALLKNPAINYIMPQTDAYAPGAITGIQNANATSRVKIASTTAVLGGLQLLKSNPIGIADVGVSANYIGWVFADAGIRMMLGDTIPSSYPNLVRAFTKANVGGIQLTPADETGNAWYGPATYQAAFERAWGVS